MHARTLSFALGAAMAAAAASAAPTILTFEEHPAGTVLTNQYGSLGVSFRGAYVDRRPVAHSGDRVLYSGNPVDEFDPGWLIVDFASGQRTVALYAGIEGNTAWTATLTAYDASGAVVGQDGPRSLPPGQLVTRMQVSAPTAVIRRVELKYPGTAFETIDDLEFEGQAAPPVPTTAPTVRITAPTPNQQTAARSFTVTGTVSGRQLAAQAKATVQVRRPPGSTTTSVYNYPVPLAGTGSVRRFSREVTLHLGPQTITVEAENAGGVHGQASVVIDALPAAIRSRYAAEGGMGALGAFSFGGGESAACTYAVYERGAVALVNGQTRVLKGAIFTKWLALPDLGRFPRLGCPSGEERPVAGNGRAQDFAGGRIYAQGEAAFFVPPYFTGAIDALGGEAGVGLPVADPTSDSRSFFLTWHFQQFRRAGVDLPTTLEIRGEPPRLYVERQAGDGWLFEGVRRPRNPTLVQVFDCQGTSGPCPVPAPPVEPPFPNAASYCNNETFNWAEFVAHAGSLNTYTPNPPEWVAIHGHYVQTPLWGVVADSHRAGGDNPQAHENVFTPCPWPPGPTSLPDLVDDLANERICPSDWDVLVRPLRGYRSMQAVQRDHVAVEWEQVHGQAFMVGYGEPLPGHVVFASGRFIADCGHAPIKTEIHPPSVLAVVGTVMREGAPATQADIWVNAFFPGGTGPGDVVEFDVYPPPRPSASATLGVLQPAEAGIRVQVTFATVARFGPVRVRVSAPRREAPVDKLGQMKWPQGGIPGGFQGRLLLFWHE